LELENPEETWPLYAWLGRCNIFKVDFQDTGCDGMDWIYVRVQW